MWGERRALLGRRAGDGAIRYIKIRRIDGSLEDPTSALEYWCTDDGRMDALLDLGNLRSLEKHSLEVAAGMRALDGIGAWPEAGPAETATSEGEYLTAARGEEAELAVLCEGGRARLWLLTPAHSCERIEAALTAAVAAGEAIRRAIAMFDKSMTMSASRRVPLRAAARAEATACAQLLSRYAPRDLIPLADWRDQVMRLDVSRASSAATERRPTTRALDDARSAMDRIEVFIEYGRRLHERLLATGGEEPTWEWPATEVAAGPE